MAPPSGDSAHGSSELLADMYTFLQSSLVFTDPPDHTRLRRLVIAAFVPSVINELAGPVSMITNRLLDDHAESLDCQAPCRADADSCARAVARGVAFRG